MVVDGSTTAVVSLVSGADLVRESIPVDSDTGLWLQTASGCVNLQPTVVKLQQNREQLHGPELLRHIAPKHRVQLLGLPLAALKQQQPSRSLIYTTAILQHAALLLLLLVSDSLLLVVPAAAVPASLLQLLHVLTRVKQLLLQQLLAIQRHEKLHRRAQQHQQGTDEQHASGSEEAEQQHDRLLQLLQQKQPTQLHIILQAAPNDAAAAVAQAEQTLLKCKAITAAASLQQGGRRTPASGSSGSSSRAGSPLFELAGVHCCGSSISTAQASRKLVMDAIKKRLAEADQLAVLQQRIPKEQQRATTTSQKKEQQQQQQTVAPPQLQSVSQVLASLAAAAGAAAGQSTAAAERAMHSITGPMSETDLQQLWQQLLQLLFPDAAKAPKSYPLHTHAAMQLSDTLDDAIAAGDDVTDASEDDGSWDESDGGWQEVGHGNESHGPGEGAETAGEILAAAVDPLFLLSAKRCLAAAKAAVGHYLKIVPQRYSQATHEAAAAQAIALYTATASGPAQQEMQQQLMDCCLAAWQAGRQQCSATSLTGRQCTLGPHDSTVGHDSGALLRIATPDGSSVAQQHDWFNLNQANIAPAEALKQQQQQQVPGSKLLQLVNITARLLVYQQQQESAASSSNHGSKMVSQLGPWLSAWVLGFGGAACNPGDGLLGPNWLPGFNKLLPLRVLAPAADVGSSAVASDAPELIQGAARGTAGRGRAAAAGGGGRGPWGTGRGQKGGRGQHGKAAAAAAPTLGPEDFPTLAEAVIGRKQPVGPGPAAAAASGAADWQQQQRKEDQGETAALLAQQGGEASRKAGGRGAQQQEVVAAAQQQLIQAWAQLGQPQQQGGGMAAGSSRSSLGTGNAASANAAAAGAGGRRDKSEGNARGRGGSRGRGRGGRQDQNRGAAAAVVGSSDDRAQETAALLATVWIGLEYESLSGVRAVLQPVQLLQSLQQEQQQRTAAAAAASSAVRNLPAADRHQQKRGGGRVAAPPARQQQEQAQHQHGGNNLDQVSGVEQLLLQDIPLFMPAAAIATAQAGNAATDTQAAAAPQLGAVYSTEQKLLLPVDLELLQLQRIYIRTPAASFALVSKPCVHFSSTAAAAAGGAGAAGQPSDSSSSSRPTVGLSTVQVSSGDAESTSQSSTLGMRHQEVPSATAASAPTSSSAASVSIIEFSTEHALTLPPDSLIVLHLPKVYVAPSSWAHQVDPAAAAAMPTAALQSSDSSCSSSNNSADRSMHVRHQAGAADATTAAAGNVAGPGMSADVSCAGSQATSEHSSTAAHAAAEVHAVVGEIGVAKTTATCEILSPLIPGKLTSAAGTVIGSSSDGEALCCWSACLKAGSWLYPAASRAAAEGQQ